jgi:adenylate kinase
VLLDGFPRTRAQAESLSRALASGGSSVDAVISLEVPDEDIVERITGRRICPACGQGYHVRFLPPEKAGHCDKDGAVLIQRPDDTEEVVKQRLQAYHDQTEPVKTYYRERGLLSEVDGTRSMEDVGDSACQAVQSRVCGCESGG